jgi:hypothetical protein
MSTKKPKPDDQDQRTPAETAQLARDVMRKMLETPPKPFTKKKKSRPK